MDINNTQLQFFAQFLRDTSGYNLIPEKKYLLETRLESVLKKNNISDIDTIIHSLRTNSSNALSRDVIEAMTVNETFFFRDKSPFDYFIQTIIPEFVKDNPKSPIRIWSAACSTGQEPYSIAMLLEQYTEAHPSFQYEIVASDINQQVIEKAISGLFSNIEIERGLPDSYKRSFFTQTESGWLIADKIRNKVSFKTINLKDDIPLAGRFHFILLRNVLIYFDQDTKKQILTHITGKLHDNGYLLLGSAEYMNAYSLPFTTSSDIHGLHRLGHFQVISRQKPHFPAPYSSL